jgi:hypothetical protein
MYVVWSRAWLGIVSGGITDREGKRVQRVGMQQASHRLKRNVAPARANANDEI